MAEFTVAQLVESGLKAGVAPCEIRRKLQSIGVRWSYGWSVQVKDDETGVPRRKAFPGGAKERARRLKTLPWDQKDGSHCVCGRLKPVGHNADLCIVCLEEKWKA